jgi:MFS family permease
MASVVLLAVIYLALIGRGLPDGVFGVAWPAMGAGIGAPLEAAGAIGLVGIGSAAGSSIFSGRILGRFGWPRVVLASTVMSGVALAGFALAPSYWALSAGRLTDT